MPVVTGTDIDARDLQKALFSFIDQEVGPIEERLGDVLHDPRKYWREDGRLSEEMVGARREARMASARAGFYTMFCPVELGGGGLGARLYFEVWEALCHRYGSPQKGLAFYILAHTSTGPTALWSHASDDLKSLMLPKLTKGEAQGSFAMSEPNAGSDAWMMSTTAVRDGDEWVLNGQKQWATFCPTADFLITFAVTDPELFAARKGGLTCFYVPTDSPGYRMESIVRVFDEIGGEEAILSFSDVRIPDTYRIGPANQGFRVAMQGSDQLRLTKLGRVIGLGRWALGQAFEYSQSRRTFGKALSEHQTVQNMLAESCIRVHAAKLMSIDLADKIDRGESVRAETAMTHAYTVEAMYEVYDRAMQVLGGMGLANETGFINGWHHIRVARIAEGPTEIQLRTIMNQLLRGGVSL